MNGFDVYLPSNSNVIDLWSEESLPYTVGGRAELVLIDTVYYGDTDNVTTDEVKHSLIFHDGYPGDIVVRKSVG